MDVHGQLNRMLFVPFYDRRDGRSRLKHVGEIEAFNSLGAQEMRDVQWQCVVNTLGHVFEKVPFYRRRFEEAGITPNDIRSPADLVQLPELTRNDIRNHRDELKAEGIDTQTLIETATGGTTSSPVAFSLDKECFDLRQAATLAFNRWFGYEVGDKAVFLWGAAQDFPEKQGMAAVKATVRNFLTSRILWLPSSYLDDTILASYCERLAQYRPKVIQAYPTPLYLLAKYMAERHITPYMPETITVTAECLYDHQREMIESVFKQKIFNWYGSRELGHMASECSQHNGLHINSYHLFFETIRHGTQVIDEEGTLVVTDLRNRAMPLIRYNIGDVGVVSERNCPCGSHLPILEHVAGRIVDTFVTPSGARVPGVGLTNRIVKSCDGIEQMQVVQKTPDTFVMRIVKGQSFSDKDLEALDTTMETFFRTKLNLRHEFVDRIPVTKSGKSRFCISEVEQTVQGVTGDHG